MSVPLFKSLHISDTDIAIVTKMLGLFIGTSLIGIPVALLAWFVWRNHPTGRRPAIAAV